MSIAYGLRAEYEGTVEQDGAQVPRYLGGLIALGEGRDLDVAQALRDGAGTIVIEETDTLAVVALDAYAPLKRVPAHDADATIPSQYADRPVADLRADLRARGLDTSGAKTDLVARLDDADRAVAAGEQPGTVTTGDEGRAGSTTTNPTEV